MRRRYVAWIVPIAVVTAIVGGTWRFLASLNDSLIYGNASPLHRAVIKGDPEKVRELLSKGANVNQRMFASENPDGWDATPLHLAARLNRVEILEELIRAGAEKDAVDRLGYTPFHGALDKGADAAAQALITSGASLRAPVGQGKAAYAVENSGTPMRTAFQQASITTVRAMIAAGVDPIIEIGENALGWVDSPDLLLKLQLLVDRGFSVEGKDSQGRRALHVAASNNDVAAIQFLIEHGADIEAIGGDYGFTPLLSAAYAGANESIITLLEHGANARAAANEFGSPLYVAAFAGKTETVRLLLAMKLGINVQAGRPSDNATPLHMAYWNADAEMARLLIAAGADQNSRTNDGRLPTEFHK